MNWISIIVGSVITIIVGTITIIFSNKNSEKQEKRIQENNDYQYKPDLCVNIDLINNDVEIKVKNKNRDVSALEGEISFGLRIVIDGSDSYHIENNGIIKFGEIIPKSEIKIKPYRLNQFISGLFPVLEHHKLDKINFVIGISAKCVSEHRKIIGFGDFISAKLKYENGELKILSIV